MIEDLKLLLGMEDTDKKTEQQLQLILNATKQRLKFLLGGLEPPEGDGIHHIGCFGHSIQPDRLGRALLSQC